MKDLLVNSSLAAFVFITGICEAHAGTVKGKLRASDGGVQNYKVVAISRNSKTKVTSVKPSGKFAVAATKGTTLHLVSSSGRYFGPVGGTKGSKFYPKLSGNSGDLGVISVASSFAKFNYKNQIEKQALLDRQKIAFNAQTGPRGAGKFGLVSTQAAAAVKAANSPQLGDDGDRDGLPDILDIDDDGDLILDVTDRVEHAQSPFQGETFSTLRLGLSESLNINTGAATEEQIDSRIRDNLILQIFIRNNTSSTILSANVDCQSLSYCAPGAGSATIRMDSAVGLEGTLWTSYDPDADGFPNLGTSTNMPSIGIKPHASRAELRTGDTIFLKMKTSSGAQAVPAVIPFIFASVPALKEYSNNGTTTAVTYPASANGPGSSASPFVLQSQQVTLTFWKPQRAAVEGAESPGLIDMGRLGYGVFLSVEGEGLSTPKTCQASEFSGLSQSFEVDSDASEIQALKDTALDTPASNTNTLSYTLDIGACLGRQGVASAGKKIRLDLAATSASQDQTSQTLYFQLP